MKPRKKRANKQSRKYSHNKWFDSACESKRKEFLSMKNKIRTTKNSLEKEQLARQYRVKNREYKKFIKKAKNKYNKVFQKKLRELKSKSPKDYWNIINRSSDAKGITGKIAMSTFLDHFKKLNQNSNAETTEDIQTEFDPLLINQSENSIINMAFTFEEISKTIRNLKNNKACGIDNIINEYLKNSPVEMLELVVQMFNTVLETSIVPTTWCIGMIQPLYKKGPTNDPDNYRGITLLSCLGKLFTACINYRLSSFLDSCGALGEEQAGFRDGYCTLDHIFVLHSVIDLYLSNRKRVYCAFVDYKKAFDLVDRSSLWSKLIAHGVNGKVMSVIYNMYGNAKSCVKQGKQLSDTFACNVGVRQGENLSPLLFAIYLNDFESFLSERYEGIKLYGPDGSENLKPGNDIDCFVQLFVLLYADDTIVLADSPEQLQAALSALYDYCKQWKLTVNISKTKVVIFSRGKVRKYPVFMYGDCKLEVVDDYIYLGSKFNYNGKFNKAIAKQVMQAKRAMFDLLTKSRRLSLPIDIQLELFDRMVVPILLYGSEVWGFSNIEQIEVMYRKFLKYLLRLPKSTPNCMVYGETGRQPLSELVKHRMISFWIKICNSKASKLSNIVCKLLLNLHTTNLYHSPWISFIKYILDKSGYSEMWLNQEYYSNCTYVKMLLKTRLRDMFLQNWKTQVSTNKACINYRLFKTDLKLESYLCHLRYSDRISLSKFRCASHKLPVFESRITQGITSNVCTLCDSAETGDEFHYILNCKTFISERKSLIKEYYYTRPSVLTFQKLFQTENIKDLSNLAKFTKIILSRL